MTTPIRFDNGIAYEEYMGRWSQQVGEAFLEWLAPAKGLRWLDVGCGNGAFTEQIATRTAPAAMTGIDPSAEMLNFARAREPLRAAQFHQGSAMALPFADKSFDVAVMPLVIFFVPEPAKGVADLARVVRPGGTVAAYSWDMDNGGFPYSMVQAAMREMGLAVSMPPHPEASRFDVKRSLWQRAGLQEIETREITVERTFENFDDYWRILLGGPSMGATLAALGAQDATRMRALVRERLQAPATGAFRYSGRANAIKGRVLK